MHRLRSLLLSVAVVLGCAVTAAPASAGTYVVWSCRDATDAPISGEGWSAVNGLGASGSVSNGCSSANRLTATFGAPVATSLTQSTFSTWEYKVPDLTLIRATVDVSWAIDDSQVTGEAHAGAKVGVYAGSAGMNAAGSGLFLGCGSWQSACATRARSWLDLGGVPSGRLVFGVGCIVQEAGGACKGPPNRATISVYRARLVLSDPVGPTATGVGGSIVGAQPVGGIQSLSLSARDVGSGVAYAEVKLGSKVVVAREPVEPANYQCRESLGDTEAFTPGLGDGVNSPVPCKTSLPLTYAIDTTTVPDGTHTLTVSLWDASGEKTTPVSRTVTVQNGPTPVLTPTPTPSPTSAPAPTTTPAPVPTASPVPVPAPTQVPGPGPEEPAANGIGDIATAHFASKATSTTETVAYGRSLSLSDRLVDRKGDPIAGAAVDVLETAPKASTTRVATVVTDVKGRFSYRPSSTAPRLVEFAYARQRGSVSYADRRSIKVRITTDVSLKSAQRSVARGSVVLFKGTVKAGTLPKRGLRLVLETRGPRGWLIGGVVKSDAAGDFTWSHAFSHAGSYGFRARVLATEGLTVSPGSSALATVRVR